jgi:lipoate-protein ligase A
MRVIIDGALSGKENMARDEALLAAGEPALRFYQWNPPCVSIGYFQHPERDIDLDFLKRAGIDLVRRPTGGRAVLHEDELTYAIVLPEALLPAGVVPSYRFIAGVFLDSLRELGLACRLQGPDGRPDRSAGCFASTSAYEMCHQGKKVMGSAQVRRNGSVLQHGSLLLSVDYKRQAACLKGPAAVPAGELEKRMAGLRTWLGENASPARLIPILRKHFLRTFASRPAGLPSDGVLSRRRLCDRF